MSENATSLAVTPQNHNTSVALQAARETQLIPASAAILDRANLQFFADMIVAADLIPYDKNITPAVQKFRVMAKIVAGVAHEFDPISSQENMHVIQGRAVLSARGMAIKMGRLGYSPKVKVLDDDKCVVAVIKETDDGKFIELGTAEFTYEMAKKSGVASSNSVWGKYRHDMLFANALKRAVRRYCPRAMDTVPVLYDTARRPELPTMNTPEPQPDPTPQPEPTAQARPTTTITEPEYVEMEFAGEPEPSAEPEGLAAEFMDDGPVDGEIVDDGDEPDSDADSASTLTYDEAKQLVDETISGMKAADVKRILNGRKPDGDVKYLLAIHAELTA